MVDVLVIGGGNAALCAALTAGSKELRYSFSKRLHGNGAGKFSTHA